MKGVNFLFGSCKLKSLKFIYFLARYNPNKYPKVQVNDDSYKGLDNNKIPLKILTRGNTKDQNSIIIFPGASPDAEKHTGLLFLASIICKLGYKVFIPRIPPLKELKLNSECFDWFAHAYSEIINRDDISKDKVKDKFPFESETIVPEPVITTSTSPMNPVGSKSLVSNEIV